MCEFVCFLSISWSTWSSSVGRRCFFSTSNLISSHKSFRCVSSALEAFSGFSFYLNVSGNCKSPRKEGKRKRGTFILKQKNWRWGKRGNKSSKKKRQFAVMETVLKKRKKWEKTNRLHWWADISLIKKLQWHFLEKCGISKYFDEFQINQSNDKNSEKYIKSDA